MKAVRELFLTIMRAVLSLAIVYTCAATATDPNKVLRVAQGDIETLDPQQWGDYFSSWVGVAIFEGLYEWDYLVRPARLAPNTAAALPRISDDGRTWTISLKPGIYFTDDPVFAGKTRELTAQD